MIIIVLSFHCFIVSSVKSKAALAADASTVARNRAKFFDIPLSTGEQQQRCDEDSGDEIIDNSHHESKKNTIGCQTIYREQSAQTRPYFPEPQIQRDTDLPEIVYVADLIDGDEIPGRYEAKVVLRARKRRNWEKLLQVASASGIEANEKRLILEAFEWENWLAREEDLENEQQERLDYVRRMLNERTKLHATNSIGRLNESIERVTKECERDMARIQ